MPCPRHDDATTRCGTRTKCDAGVFWADENNGLGIEIRCHTDITPRGVPDVPHVPQPDTLMPRCRTRVQQNDVLVVRVVQG